MEFNIECESNPKMSDINFLTDKINFDSKQNGISEQAIPFAFLLEIKIGK